MLIWFVFCVLDGIIDAFMFYNRISYDNRILGRDIHVFLFLRRFTVVFLIIMIFDIEAAFMCVLTQPLIHNGVYFMTRNNLDGSYPMGFWTSKDIDDSTALIDIDNIYVRLILFAAGIAFLWV